MVKEDIDFSGQHIKNKFDIVVVVSKDQKQIQEEIKLENFIIILGGIFITQRNLSFN